MTEPLPDDEFRERVNEVGVDRAAWEEHERGVQVPEPLERDDDEG